MRKLIILLAAAAALVCAASASATTIPSGCQQWDLSYNRLYQSNGWDVHFDFRTAAFSTFDGQARAFDRTGAFAGFGTVQGTLFGDDMNFSIQWRSGPIGIYTAKINRWGQAFGTTWDMRAPWSKGTWRLEPFARCARWNP